MKTPLKVLIRTDRSKSLRTVAIFADRSPRLRFSRVEGYCPGEGHFEADVSWMKNRTRPATPEESKSVLASLASVYPDHEIIVVQRLSRPL